MAAHVDAAMSERYSLDPVTRTRFAARRPRANQG
jgi:hypothetical protein